ncbi:MAG: DUF3883 domain-containing protein [Bacteroidales bacterium]|jgi:hypothetical protein
MNYKDKFRQADTEAFNASIARDILERMDKLRLGANNNLKRRWVWELIQNAKDAAQRDLPVEIKINLSDDKLIFSHNGKCFTANDITFLIRQVSNKDREASEQEFDHKPTGKFGTGFLTTHLLSEQVEIIGIAKEPELDYRQFVLPLDRSGRTKDEIEQSVNRSIGVRDTLDEKPAYSNYNSKYFNTTFSYNLNEEGKQTAEIGINDLRISLPYALAFSSMIKSVNIENQNLLYEIVNRIPLNEDIELCKIALKNNGNSDKINIIKLSTNNVSIAIEIEYKNGRVFIKEFAEKLPRLFCDFPLIGTRTFNMPVIINSSDFNPTEPRDGIWLTDRDAEPKIAQNKELFLEAINLYYKLFHYAIDNKWGNLYNLANTNAAEEKEWFSKNWIETNFQKPTRDKIKSLPIVELENGEFALIKNSNEQYNVYFPHHTKDEVRDKIWELEYKLFPNKVPAKRDIRNWDKILWSDCFKDSVKAITEFIQDEKTIEELAKRVNNDTGKAIEWLNEYYDLLNFENTFIQEIINDKYSVIPNQNGIFKKRTELNIDSNIDEELKNVLCILGNDPKNHLVHKSIITKSKYKEEVEGQILYCVKSQDNIIEDINSILESRNNTNSGKAISYLISLFCDDDKFPKHRETLYNYCIQLQIELPEKKNLINWSDTIWKNCDTPRISRLIKIVSEQQNLSELTVFLELKSENETIDWLNEFIQFIKERGLSEQLNLKNNPILPNQNGDFCAKEDLTFDSGEIDEPLKDILESLGYPIKSELINNDIFIELSKTAERKPDYVATEISNRIIPKFSEFPRTEETRKIFKSLYFWFSKNKHIAKSLFRDLYNNKHKLYDDEEIAENMEKAEIFDKLLTETGLSIEDVKNKLLLDTSLVTSEEIEKLEKEKEELEAKVAELTAQVENSVSNTVINEITTEFPDITADKIRELLKLEERIKGWSGKSDYQPANEEEERRNYENGYKGEAYIYRQLVKSGNFKDVVWEHKSEIPTDIEIIDFEGNNHYIKDNGSKYDLTAETFEGKKIYIEVKSTRTTIDEADRIALPISSREWRFVNQISENDRYCLARVFDVENNPEGHYLSLMGIGLNTTASS